MATGASESSSRGTSDGGQASVTPEVGREAQLKTAGKPPKQRTLTTKNAVKRAKNRSARVTASQSCRGVRALSSTGRDGAQA